MTRFIVSFSAMLMALKNRKMSESMLEDAYFIFGSRRSHVLCDTGLAPVEITWGGRGPAATESHYPLTLLLVENQQLWKLVRSQIEIADGQGRIIWDADCSQPGIAQALYRAGLRDTTELHEVWHGDHKLVYTDVNKNITMKELLNNCGPGAYGTFWQALAISTYYDAEACAERATARRLCNNQQVWPE